LNIHCFIHSIFRNRETIKNRESDSWDSLSCQIDYHFKNLELLKEAMTHRSVCQDKDMKRFSNERLEFLGDAVLGLVITDELFHRFPDHDEGQLTKAKSHLVSREVLFKQAEKMDLGQYLLVSNGEEKSGGRTRQSILADAFEAVIGAIFIDGGLEAVRRFIQRHLLKDMDSLLSSKYHHNFKSLLLETVQARGELIPQYRVVFESGPDHHKEFTVEVIVDGKGMGRGTGSSKKKAEQRAACEALQQMGVISKNRTNESRRK
jgi:ribonuclease-3